MSMLFLDSTRGRCYNGQQDISSETALSHSRTDGRKTADILHLLSRPRSRDCSRRLILPKRRATMVWPRISGRRQTHGTKPLNVGPMLQERNSRNASESTGTTSESLLRILPTLSFQVQHLSLSEIVP